MTTITRNLMVQFAAEYFPPPPPPPLPTALPPPSTVIVHPSVLTDLRTFLNKPKADFRHPKQGELITKMRSRERHVLGILACDFGKTTLIMMVAKMYDPHLVTLVILPLSGLHRDLHERAREHRLAVSQWMSGRDTFNDAVSLIYVCIEQAVDDAFLE
jgi:superfamily II DNA helicase RecQ